MRLLHLHPPHRPVPVDEAAEPLAEAGTTVRRGLATAAWALLAEALFLLPLVVVVLLVLVGRALL